MEETLRAKERRWYGLDGHWQVYVEGLILAVCLYGDAYPQKQVYDIRNAMVSVAVDMG